MKLITENRKARFNFEILEEIEAGIALQGTEVKSMRLNNASMSDAYAVEKEGEIWLNHLHVAEYKNSRDNHKPKRARRLLLRKKQIRRLIGSASAKGTTIIPLSLYFNEKNLVKVLLGVAKHKKLYDKRQAIKEREWTRRKQRLEL